MYDFLKNSMEISMKKTRSADFCEDRIDVITNFAVITNAVIKRVYCNYFKAARYYFWRRSIVFASLDCFQYLDQTNWEVIFFCYSRGVVGWCDGAG